MLSSFSRRCFSLIKEADYIKFSEYAERMSVNYRTVYRKFHDNKIEDLIQDFISIITSY